jgi:hypothetical protein
MFSAAILGAATLAGAAAATEPFAPLRWKHRLLIVFAQGDRDREVTQLQALPADGIRSRDLIVVRVPARGDAAVPGLGAVPAASIRKVYGVGEESSFTVLLVGKDGGVKQRASEPIAARELFATIDAMPMRRQEMREP